MTNVRERLAKALDNYEEERKESRQVVIAPSQHDRDLLIDTLTLLASFDSVQPTRAFRTPSREMTQNELSDIATRASDLSTRLRDPKCSVTRAREQLAQRLEDMHSFAEEMCAALTRWAEHVERVVTGSGEVKVIKLKGNRI